MCLVVFCPLPSLYFGKIAQEMNDVNADDTDYADGNSGNQCKITIILC